jgi:hypothetical protein
MKRPMFAALVGLTVSLPGRVLGQATPAVCAARDITVGVFNERAGDELDALVGALRLRDALGPQNGSDQLRYDLFYSFEGARPGSTHLDALRAAFAARAKAIDPAGELAERYELLWDALSPGPDGWWDALVEARPEAADARAGLHTDIAGLIAAATSVLAEEPLTDEAWAVQRARLETLRVEAQRFLLVGHGSGNAVMSEAYDYLFYNATPQSFAAYHVAPGAQELRGDQRSASTDEVLLVLRAAGGTPALPPANVAVRESAADPYGHALTSYLEPGSGSEETLLADLRGRLAWLRRSTSTGRAGLFTVAVTWDGDGDLDLHVYEPDGSHVYWDAPGGVSGRLDIENSRSYGPEHYYAACSTDTLQTGTYAVHINHYDGAVGRTVTLQVASSDGGLLTSRSFPAGEPQKEAGDAAPRRVLGVTVAQDASSGAYTVAVE